ncbi:MAG: DUF4097 family beta strand repeat protein [Limnochordales bacterium]|nr:DUF4097 family beta strand repeat protein [Limnochordales bacterium]
MKEKQLVLLGLALVILVSFLDSFAGVMSGYEEAVQIRDEAGNLVRVGEDGSLPLQAVQKGELTGSLAAGQVLKVSLPMGEIDLSGVKEGEEGEEGEQGEQGVGAADAAQLQYEVRVYGRNKEVAQEYAGRVKVSLRPLSGTPGASGVAGTAGEAGGGLELVVDEPPRPAELKVKVVVRGTLPAAARVDLENGYGLVRVTDLSGPSTVRNGYGPTELGRLAGDWSVEADYSALLVDGIAGDLEMRGDYSEANISHVGGDLTIRSDYKDIRVADVRGDLDVKGDYGSLQFEDVAGSVTLDVGYKDVRGDGIGGDVRASSSYGDLRLAGLRRNVEIEAEFAKVDLGFAAPPDHRFHLRSRYGSIADDLSVTEERSAGSFEKLREGVAGRGQYRVSVETDYGDIHVWEAAARNR